MTKNNKYVEELLEVARIFAERRPVWMVNEAALIDAYSRMRAAEITADWKPSVDGRVWDSESNP